MAGLDNIRYLIEALRTKGREPGIYRDPGRLPIRVRGGNPVKNTGSDLNYVKYQRMQNAMGEEPVSYEEWLRQ